MAKQAAIGVYRGYMARQRRSFLAGGVYHVFSRGSNRQAIFAYDSDRADFLSCLDRVVHIHDLRCLGYCLLSNHYHLVLETPDGRLSEAMKALNGRYALRFNRRYGRDAHLFKNRFGAVVQESESQLRWLLRYTVLNPVESGLCSEPGEWPWSSYRASVGETAAPSFLDVDGLLSYFGDESAAAVSRYREFVTSIPGPAGV